MQHDFKAHISLALNNPTNFLLSCLFWGICCKWKWVVGYISMGMTWVETLVHAQRVDLNVWKVGVQILQVGISV
jgi:hypothetical protein